MAKKQLWHRCGASRLTADRRVKTMNIDSLRGQRGRIYVARKGTVTVIVLEGEVLVDSGSGT